MDSRVKKFRAGVAALGGSRRGLRYPENLKRLAVSYWQGASREDEPLAGVASELGISQATLERWAADSGESEEVGEVQEVVLAGTLMPPVLCLSIVTPDGYRVEGLGVGDVPALLRLLR